jgi:hypothetical protein
MAAWRGVHGSISIKAIHQGWRLSTVLDFGRISWKCHPLLVLSGNMQGVTFRKFGQEK